MFAYTLSGQARRNVVVSLAESQATLLLDNVSLDANIPLAKLALLRTAISRSAGQRARRRMLGSLLSELNVRLPSFGLVWVSQPSKVLDTLVLVLVSAAIGMVYKRKTDDGIDT